MAYEEVIIGILATTFALLIFVVWRMSRLSSELRKIQQDVTDRTAPIQSLSGITGGLASSVSNLQAEVGNIRVQAERIATLSEKYEKTEELTKKIHSIMIGSYSKGRTGEQVLKGVMADLVRAGFVETNVPFGTRVVEYAVKFSDGKIVAIDSKMVGTDELERLHDEAIPEEERNARAANLVLKLRGKIDEVAGYIEPGRTLPFSIMAIPDSLVEYGANLIGEASKRNVIILGYSSVPPLIEYFFKIHSSYTIQQDVEAIFQSMMSAQQSLSRFTDSYFANRFLKPLQVLTRAVGELQGGVRKALQSMNVERGAPHQEEHSVEAIIPDPAEEKQERD